MRATAGFLYRVPAEITRLHLEPRHEAGTALWHVPVARDLHGIVFAEHRIEDGLLRQPRWKRRHARLSDQVEFLRADGPPECGRGFAHGASIANLRADFQPPTAAASPATSRWRRETPWRRSSPGSRAMHAACPWRAGSTPW